jgi:hypothetical protein
VSPSKTAPPSRTVQATFNLPGARYIDVDTGQIIVAANQQPGDTMDYQIEPGNPGTVTPRGHALLSPQGSDTRCADRQAENSQLRYFTDGAFCGTSGALAPAEPKYFELKIISFEGGQLTISVTYL